MSRAPGPRFFSRAARVVGGRAALSPAPVAATADRWHFDLVDNLIYCAAGSKRLRVAGPGVGSPVAVDAMLRPGDALWVPAGHYHRGQGSGAGRSVIWSLGFRAGGDGAGGSSGLRQAELEAKQKADFALLATQGWSFFAAGKEGGEAEPARGGEERRNVER